MGFESSYLSVSVILGGKLAVSETFIRAHAEQLPARGGFITGWWPQDEDGVQYQPSLLKRVVGRLERKLGRRREKRCPDFTAAYLSVLQRRRPDVVLAEYGTTGERVVEACKRAGVPLVVHFHGYDASIRKVIAEQGNYQRIFRDAAGVIAVSRAMEARLLALGVARSKLYYNPYGVELQKFTPGDPARADEVFVAAGRFVEKKAPHLTILAFRRVLERHPTARLCMIGDGPLLPICRDIAKELGLEAAVTFLGSQPHEVVQAEMQKARAFVQHSVEASDGDCEGTPVAVLEAGASALPVIATRHAGIPDVVKDGRTGLLVEERDVAGMASHMIRLAQDAQLAGTIGRAAAEHVREKYSMQRSIDNLRNIIGQCVASVRKPVATGG